MPSALLGRRTASEGTAAACHGRVPAEHGIWIGRRGWSMSTCKKVEKSSFIKTRLKASLKYTRTRKILASHLQCRVRPKAKLEIILNETKRGTEKRVRGSGLESVGARDQPES